MATFSPIPTYYRITWDDSLTVDYSSVSITPLTSIQYNNSVVLTSGNSPDPNAGDTVTLNGYVIGPFDESEALSTIIDKFNLMLPYTNVMASENWSGYLTLQSIDPVKQPILLQDSGNSELARLALPSGEFGLYNPTYGGSFGTLHNGNTAVINGVTVTFTTGAGLDLAGAINTINGRTGATHVVATRWTDKIQLNHQQGQPILFGTGSPGTSTALGFANGTVYGGGMSPDSAILMEEGYLRWKGIQNSIESIVTPHYYGSVVMTGSTTDGYQLPDTVSWTVGIEHIDQMSTVTLPTEPEGAGYTLVGPAAVKRLVARGLAQTYVENRKVYNNDISAGGSSGQRLNPVYVKTVTAVLTDSNVTALESNITVTQIPNA